MQGGHWTSNLTNGYNRIKNGRGGGTFFTGGSCAAVAIAISTPLIASVAVSAGAIATAKMSFEYSVGQFREDLDRAVEEIQKASGNRMTAKEATEGYRQ